MKRFFLLMLLSFWLGSTSINAQDSITLKSQVAKAINDLREFVAIPNDALVPDHMEDNLIWLKRQFERRGFNTVKLDTENIPLFFANKPINDSKPTILIYMHFDGQSVDPSKWDQPNPYKVVLKKETENGFETVGFETIDDDIDYNQRLFGRSTSDDKGPIIMLLNALDLMDKMETEMPVNIKIILDGEEEKGSAPLAKAVSQYKELLETDFLLIADGPMHPSERPTIVYGCRGITTISLTSFGPVVSQHSGHYGNYAPNPAMNLAQALASMKDADGKVIIPGFYDGISLDDKSKQILDNVPDDLDAIAKKLQFNTADKVGNTYQESLQYPSLNVRGLSSGWTGDKARTIVPATAVADIDIRLVPESDGKRLKKLIKNHLSKQGYHVIDHVPSEEERLGNDKIIMMTEGGMKNAFRTPLDNAYGEQIKTVLEETFGDKAVQIRIMGGTVPIAPFINELKVPAFVVPMVNADNNQHSPNENLKIDKLAYGIKAYYALLSHAFQKP